MKNDSIKSTNEVKEPEGFNCGPFRESNENCKKCKEFESCKQWLANKSEILNKMRAYATNITFEEKMFLKAMLHKVKKKATNNPSVDFKDLDFSWQLRLKAISDTAHASKVLELVQEFTYFICEDFLNDLDYFISEIVTLSIYRAIKENGELEEFYQAGTLFTLLVKAYTIEDYDKAALYFIMPEETQLLIDRGDFKIKQF